jgi:hypothetical protein
MILLLLTAIICVIAILIMLEHLCQKKKVNYIVRKPSVTNFDILYNESLGHVITAEVCGETMYLKQNVHYNDEKADYINLCRRKARHEAEKEYRRNDWYAHRYDRPQQYSIRLTDQELSKYVDQEIADRLPGSTRIVTNKTIHEYLFKDTSNYTDSIENASRYKDENIEAIEKYFIQIKQEEYRDIPLEHLLPLSIINETEMSREIFFDVITEKVLITN